MSLNHQTKIARFMGPTWSPPGSCRPQMDHILAPLTLLSGEIPVNGENVILVSHSLLLYIPGGIWSTTQPRHIYLFIYLFIYSFIYYSSIYYLFSHLFIHLFLYLSPYDMIFVTHKLAKNLGLFKSKSLMWIMISNVQFGKCLYNKVPRCYDPLCARNQMMASHRWCEAVI